MALYPPLRPAMGTYDIAKVGRVVRASADGVPRWKAGGITLDWSTVPVLSTTVDTTFGDGTVVKANQRGLRYGTILTKINASEGDTLAIDATGGTYTLSVTVDGGTVRTTTALAFGANAAAIQAALVALANVGAGNATVTGASTPFTIAFTGALAGHAVAVTADSTSLTGNTHTATVTETGAGSFQEGMFGPYLSTAIDGRQNLVRGECFVLDTSWLELDFKSASPSVFDGGLAFLARILNNGTDMTTNPSRANIEAAFPALTWVED
jgi:hypothetical protein